MKFVLQLPQPLPAAHECLPHAAMNLGAGGGAGLRPAGRMVSRLVVEEQFGQWVFYRMDDSGGFVGDSWHDSLADALRQAKKEFGVEWAV